MHRVLHQLAAFLVSAGLTGPLHAQGLPPLEFPADCRIGEDCWILSYVDLDSGPGFRDRQCGARTNDGHKGTDIALTDAFGKTVHVRAAAGGTVAGVRDGLPDNAVGDDIPEKPGRECGNGVRIDHGGGWFSQYCHLKIGSVRVSPQQVVEAGDVLGLMGNSGASETPHLQFRLNHGTDVVDPFTGESPSDPPRCGTGTSLWSEKADTEFGPYEPTFIRHAGFAVTAPTLRSVQKTPSPEELPGNRSSLYLYAVAYGLPEGSAIRFTVTDPDGKAVVTTSQTIPRDKDRQFQYAGRNTPDGGWPPGEYTGDVEVVFPSSDKVPGGTEIFLKRVSVTIR